jgi:predicted ATPase
MKRFVISGCSGGGKSALLGELARRGHRVFAEPGREIVKQQLQAGDDGLPWRNVQKFAELCIARGIVQVKQAVAEAATVAFFDRSIIDAVAALEHLNLPVPEEAALVLEAHPYDRLVFIAPPWPELFATDAERRHGFADAVAEFDRLLLAYAKRGHVTRLLPKTSLPLRADFVLRHQG